MSDNLCRCDSGKEREELFAISLLNLLKEAICMMVNC